MGHRTLALVAAAALLACSKEHEVCDNGRDDDHDSAVDCADPDCAIGALCSPLGLACDAQRACAACTGNGGTPEATEATCGDGADNDCDGLADCADPDCQPSGSAPGRACDTAGHVCGAPDATGASTCGGTGGGGGTGGAEAIGSISLAAAEYTILGALGSGYQEQSLLTFEVRTPAGTPYPDLPVAFSHASLGGSFIGATPACASSVPPVCAAQGITDADGRVSVLLRSGRTFGMVAVRAQATAAGATRSFVAGNLAVVGAKPNGARFAVDCRPYDVPAFTVHDCLYSRYAGADHEVTCTATLGDRHDNLVAIPTLVGFQTEAGLIAPADETPPFDPGEPRPPPDLGQAIGILETYGAPLPFDVAPFADERSLVWDYGCGSRTANPRDGLVTVLALVQGEEGFVDEDLDGTYDPGEPFIDLGEPFLDVDDDGVRDGGEWFLDVNQDGVYTGPNGVWDADTVLWAQTRVLFTGYPARLVVAGQELLSRIYLTGSPPDPTPVVPELPVVHVGPPSTTERFDVFVTDARLNPPLRSSADLEVQALTGSVTTAYTLPVHTADSIHMGFRQLYCDAPDGAGACADGPADQGCTTSPCYLVTQVGSGYHYGNFATGAVTGARAGTDLVQVLATVENVSASLTVPATCAP